MQICQVPTVVHVISIILVDEVAPLPTLSCQLVERDLRSVATGAALEMDDLVGPQSSVQIRADKMKAYHAVIGLELAIAAIALVNPATMRELMLYVVSG